jgi:hypothetical protein
MDLRGPSLENQPIRETKHREKAMLAEVQNDINSLR